LYIKQFVLKNSAKNEGVKNYLPPFFNEIKQIRNIVLCKHY